MTKEKEPPAYIHAGYEWTERDKEIDREYYRLTCDHDFEQVDGGPCQKCGLTFSQLLSARREIES